MRKSNKKNHSVSTSGKYTKKTHTTRGEKKQKKTGNVILSHAQQVPKKTKKMHNTNNFMFPHREQKQNNTNYLKKKRKHSTCVKATQKIIVFPHQEKIQRKRTQPVEKKN